MKIVSRLYLVVLLAVLSPMLWGQLGQEYREGLLDRDAVMEKAKAITTEVYPDADDVLVDDHILVAYEPNGVSETWDDTYIKVLTEKGRRDSQSMSLRFVLPYGTVEVALLEIIKPDGRIVPVDIAGQSKVMVDRSQMSSNIYNPNSKILSVGIPGVEVGDVVHNVVHRVTMKPRVPDTFADYQIFEYTSPIKRLFYEIRAPKALPLVSIALKDEVAGTVTAKQKETDDGIIYTWEVKNVPQIFPEPDMPSMSTVVQRLLVCTVPDWYEISRWYWNLSLPHFKTTEEMDAKVAEIVADLDDDQSRIEAIFRWVSQEVRYLGITIEKEAPGYEPHDVQLTFENRHGVCRDKAALLVAMLRTAGFDAYPVLIHAGPKKDIEAPMPYFNHAITCVELEDGEYLLMDSTDESTKDLCPAYLNNCSYLVAKPEGENLQTSPIIPAEDNMVTIKTQGTIDAEGTLMAETSIHFEGINDNAYRGYFARSKPEQHRRLFEGLVKAVTPGATLTDFLLTPADMMDTTQPIHVELSFEAEDVLAGEESLVMMPMLTMGNKVGMVNFMIGKTGLLKRRFPLVTGVACGVQETFDYELTGGFGDAISIPKFTPIDDETLHWHLAMSKEGDHLSGEAVFKLKVVEFDPEQYLSLKQTLKDLEYNARKKLLFAAADDAEGPDIKLLNSQTTYELEDERNWTQRVAVKMQILSYKGKKDYAELQMNYNPVWENVELIHATVTNGDTVQEISEKEINLMDASWAASAPRYPAGKTLVASLPGVEIGSIIEYEYVREVKGYPFFSFDKSFRGYQPAVHRSIEVVMPEDLEPRMLIDQNGISQADRPTDDEVIEFSERSDDGKVTYRWEANDQEAMKQEDGVPPLMTFVPSMVVSYGDWGRYAEEVLAALELRTVMPLEAAGQSMALTEELTTAEDKIRAIRDYVAKNIRAAGPGLGSLPLSALSAADVTLADGYGNNPDRAILLYAMLEEAEVGEVEFILVSSVAPMPVLEDYYLDYPNIDYFSTVLVRVTTDDDQVYYLNDTDEYDALGVTSHEGYLMLDLDDEDVARLELSNELRNYSETSYTVTFDEAANAMLSKTEEIWGTGFGSLKKQFAEMPPEQRRRYYQETIADISQGAEPTSDLVTEFDAYPGRKEFSVAIERYGVMDGDYFYFTLPQSLSRFFRLRSDDRDYPYYQGRRTHYRIVQDVVCPAGYTEVLLAPESKTIELPGDSGVLICDFDVTKDDDQLMVHVTYEVKLNPAIIDLADFDDLLEIDRKLSHVSARTFLLGKAE